MLLLRYRARVLRRWIGAHAFELFCLAPIIVGGVLWVLDRQLTHLRGPLAQFWGQDPQSLGATPLIGALLLLAFGLPSTFRELYDHRRASGYLDALPIAATTRFNASLAVEMIRILPTFGVLLLAAGALAGDLLPPITVFATRCLRLLTALWVLALARFVAALLLGHYPRLARGWWGLAGVLVLLAIAAPEPVRWLLFLPLAASAAQFQTVVTEALGVSAGQGVDLQALALISTAGVLFLAARSGYLAWHRRDLEVVAPTVGVRRKALGFLTRKTGAIAVQVRRDVTLVLRRFSQAVPLAAGLWILLDGVALTVLADDRLPELWRQRLAVAGLALSVLAVVALVPFLLKHQLPRFWIERSTGVDLEQIWRAKLWTAALLAAAPALAGVAVLSTASIDLAARGVAILQFLAAAWIITSIVALAVFEIAEQPLLGLLFGALLGLALSALFVFYPQAWWLWAALYVYVASQIAGRATRRVRLLEVTV